MALLKVILGFLMRLLFAFLFGAECWGVLFFALYLPVGIPTYLVLVFLSWVLIDHFHYEGIRHAKAQKKVQERIELG